MTQTATLTTTIGSGVTLSFSGNTVTFPSADPNTNPSVSPTEGAINVTAKARTGPTATVTLTVLANDDLRSGPNTISISNVTWTAAGAGFQGGTLSKTAAQTIGSWTGAGTRTGSITYALANNPTYVTGTYTTTLTYTLTAP